VTDIDAHEIRMEIKRLIAEARKEYPDFEPIGTIDEDDALIEALIHPELFEVKIRIKNS
jgi:hypothetical protein